MKRHDIDPVINEIDGLDNRYLKGKPDYFGEFFAIILFICFLMIIGFIFYKL